MFRKVMVIVAVAILIAQVVTPWFLWTRYEPVALQRDNKLDLIILTNFTEVTGAVILGFIIYYVIWPMWRKPSRPPEPLTKEGDPALEEWRYPQT